MDRSARITFGASGGSGINRYDKTGKSWTSFTRSDGLPEFGRLRPVSEDSDGFWVGTDDKGVLKYSQASGAWTAFTVEDGLVHDSVWRYQLKVDSKYVWVGTSRGLSRYDKEKGTWTSFTKPTTLADRRAVAVADRFPICLGRYAPRLESIRQTL